MFSVVSIVGIMNQSKYDDYVILYNVEHNRNESFFLPRITFTTRIQTVKHPLLQPERKRSVIT